MRHLSSTATSVFHVPGPTAPPSMAAAGTRLVVAALSVCAALAGTGCIFQNIGSTERLNDAVRGLNDELRWSRLDLASERVAPRYQPAFADKHRSWGRTIQIADTEYLAVRLSDDRDTAVSTIAVSWYELSTMTLRQTVVRQRWRRGGGTYLLSAEDVAEGDASLLALPPPPVTDDELDPDDLGASGEPEAVSRVGARRNPDDGSIELAQSP